MMTIEQIKELETELVRFKKRLAEVKIRLSENPDYKGSHNAALRSASSDLSRLLIELRRR